jgi:hypothetical protein
VDEVTNDWSAFAGIDWGEAHHQLCVVDADGTRQSELQVAHDVAGLAELDPELALFGPRLPVALKRSEGLLVEHLQAAGHVGFSLAATALANCSRARRDRDPAAVVKTKNLISGSPGKVSVS